MRPATPANAVTGLMLLVAAVASLAVAAPAVASAQDVGDQIIVKRTAQLSAAQSADVRSDADVTLVNSPKPAALKFKLSAGGPLVVSLAHRACPHVHDCTYRWAAKRTVKARAGVQRMTVARTVAGMRLHAGRWRLTLAVAHSRRSVHFTVHRGR